MKQRNAMCQASIRDGDTIKVGDTIYRGNTPIYEIDHRTGRVYKVAKGIPFVKVEESNG